MHSCISKRVFIFEYATIFNLVKEYFIDLIFNYKHYEDTKNKQFLHNIFIWISTLNPYKCKNYLISFFFLVVSQGRRGMTVFQTLFGKSNCCPIHGIT